MSPCAPPSDSPRNKNKALIAPRRRTVFRAFCISLLYSDAPDRSSGSRSYNPGMPVVALLLMAVLAHQQRPAPQPFPRPAASPPRPAPANPAPAGPASAAPSPQAPGTAPAEGTPTPATLGF